MEKSKIIFMAVLIGIFILFVFLMRKPKETKTAINNVEVKVQQNSTIASKLEAYKKNREQENKQQNVVPLERVSSYSKTEAVKTPSEKKEKPETTPKPAKKAKPVVEEPKTEQPPTSTELTPEEKAHLKAQRAAAWNNNRQEAPADTKNSYMAVIHGRQDITSQSPVKIRIKEEIKINGQVIPANTIITGTGSFSSNRLNININSIRVGRNVIPVTLAVYGADGLQGLPVQRDETKKLIDDEVSGELTRELDKSLKSLPGGGLLSSVTKGIKKQEELKTTLYDNTSLYLKPITK